MKRGVGMSEFLYIVVPEDSDIRLKLPAFVKERASGRVPHNKLVDLHLIELRANNPHEKCFEIKVGDADLWNLRAQKKNIVEEILRTAKEYFEAEGIPFRFEEHVFRKKQSRVHEIDATKIPANRRR